MTVNLKDLKSKLLFIPLGGTNEIGINVNLYHLNGKWIMVDCGSGFADESLPGVDMIVADLSFIEEHKKDLLGLIITHAHEDHIGGIQYLWDSLGCEIFTTNFTKNFLKNKLSEYSFENKLIINSVETGSILKLGPFAIEFFQLTHSAPEMQALMIRTSEGNILHTGDWKFDKDPVIGKPADEEKLKKFGDEGVHALVCDSTNVFNQGSSGSEGAVRDSLIDIINGCPKMVMVTTFASNLARLDTLIKAGQKCGRKVVLSGRSLHRVLDAAQSSGYLTDIEPLVDERSMGRFNRKELLVIATGCQGEPNAATSRIVTGSHQNIKLMREDTVIFSSKIIPGNDKKIFALFNNFVQNGIEVITERDHFVHVSGHPSAEELKHMYKLLRPKICIPVHGEPVHIHEQAKLAKSCGIKSAPEARNGSVVLIEHDKAEVIGEVENGYFAIDGNYLLPFNSSIFKMRRRMRDAGLVAAAIVVDSKGRLCANPAIIFPGIFDSREDYAVIEEIEREVKDAIYKLRNTNSGLMKDEIESKVKSVLKRMIKQETNKMPTIFINVEELDNF